MSCRPGMGNRLSLCLALALLCIPGAEVKAQQRTFVTGDEVRVTAPSLFPGRVRGLVLGARPDTLILELDVQREAGSAVIPLDAVETFEVARGNSQMVGAFTGVLLGVAGGAAVGNALVPGTSGDVAFVLAGIAGAAIGGFVGYQIGKGFDTLVFGRQWVEVPMSRVRWETRGFRSAAVSPGRTLTLSISIFH